MSNLTKTYPFDAMSVGSSFVVGSRFQHARVAASEYARKHNQCFTCRMQDDGSMIVYRVSNDQSKVDARGARGRRRIANPVDPTRDQFTQWVASFAVGQSYSMPSQYSHLFLAMQAWIELYAIASGRNVTAQLQGGVLVINRLA